MTLLLLVACASDDIAWAVHHASVIPTATGLDGTQTWEFFTTGWEKEHDPEAFSCARAQLVVGAVAPPLDGCADCLVAYEVIAEELDTTCAGPQATDASYGGSITMMAIGAVAPELEAADPYPGRSMGWYVSLDGATMTPYGFAYDEALDWGGQLGAAGWANDQTYTLWPAFAWDLR